MTSDPTRINAGSNGKFLGVMDFEVKGGKVVNHRYRLLPIFSNMLRPDAEMDAPVVKEVRAVIEQGKVPARITDLHVWRVGRAKYACVVSLTTTSQKDGDYFRRELEVHEELAHITVEVDHVAA